MTCQVAAIENILTVIRDSVFDEICNETNKMKYVSVELYIYIETGLEYERDGRLLVDS